MEEKNYFQVKKGLDTYILKEGENLEQIGDFIDKLNDSNEKILILKREIDLIDALVNSRPLNEEQIGLQNEVREVSINQLFVVIEHFIKNMKELTDTDINETREIYFSLKNKINNLKNRGGELTEQQKTKLLEKRRQYVQDLENLQKSFALKN